MFEFTDNRMVWEYFHRELGLHESDDFRGVLHVPEEFKGAQQLSAAVKQERGVGPGEVYENLRLLPVAILRERRVDDNAVFEAKTAMGHDGLKELIDLIGGSNFVHKKFSAIRG